MLPLHLFVPIERLTFRGAEEAPAAELRVRVLARNAGKPEPQWQSKVFRVLRPLGATGVATLILELELDRGTNVLAVALRDETSRTTSLVSTTIDVGG